MEIIANGNYCPDYALDRYGYWLSMYQARYSYPFPFLVTWQTIHFWRQNVNMWGRYLVTQGLLHKEQYLADKAFRFGDPQLIIRTQNATALTHKEVCQ